MAELVAARRASRAAAGAGADRAPARAGRRRRRVRRRAQEGELGGSAGDKPERWVRQTDFGNAEAVGYLADRLNRIGIEDRLLELGRPGRRRVAIGGARRGGLRLRPADRHRRRDPQPARRGPAVSTSRSRPCGAARRAKDRRDDARPSATPTASAGRPTADD